MTRRVYASPAVRVFWPSTIATADKDEDEGSLGMMAALRSNGVIDLSWIKCQDFDDEDSDLDEDEQAAYATPTQAELEHYFATELTWDGDWAMGEALEPEEDHQRDVQLHQTAWPSVLGGHVQSCCATPSLSSAMGQYGGEAVSG